MSYLLRHLHSGWIVDEAILAEEERAVVVRSGHDWDDTCMQKDEEIDEQAVFEDEDSEGNRDDESDIEISQDSHKSKISHRSLLDDDDDNDDEDDDDEEGSKKSLEENENEDEESNERHRNMIEAIIGKRKKDLTDKRRKKKPLLSEAYPESEFNVNPSSINDGNKSGPRQVTVDDLLSSLHGTTGFGSLRKRMQQIQKRELPVQAPLPKVIQERLERKAGYEKTSEYITKWQDIVKENREAPTLFFNTRVDLAPISTAALASKFVPATKLEKEVSALLKESGIADLEEERSGKELELNKFTVQEVKERQERLAKMRNLLFQHEAKAKRIKKIKSKTFHRLLQKDHKRRLFDGLESGTDPEAAKAASLKQEFLRAQERMTLKHKNTSRWAKRILKRGSKAKEDGSRIAIAEQLRQHALLKRKIHSATLSSSDESSNEEDDSINVQTGGNDLVLTSKRRSKDLARAKVETLKVLEASEEAVIPTSGLFSLPFMARAIEKKRKQANEEAQTALEEFEELNDSDENNLESVNVEYMDKEKQNGSLNVPFEFEDNSHCSKDVNESLLESTHWDVETSMAEVGIMDNNSGMELSGKVYAERPWLFGVSEKQHSAEQAGENLVNSKTTMGSFNEHDEMQKNCKFLKDSEVPVTIVGSSLNNTQTKNFLEDHMIGSITEHTESDPKSHSKVETNHDLSESESEEELTNDESLKGSGFQVLNEGTTQEELIQRAFAGDDVEVEFKQMKEKALDEEFPQGEGTINLPGWGQWTDVQKKKGLPRWILKEQDDLKKKRELALRKRKDAKLKYVVISEKVDKKAEKFVSPSLPFPYTSREVFERSIRMPIGRDFNTDQAFRDMIRPSVVKDAGVIISPIKYNGREQ